VRSSIMTAGALMTKSQSYRSGLCEVEDTVLVYSLGMDNPT